MSEKGARAVQSVKKNVYLLGVLVKQSIRNQYYNSVLGILWTVLNPLLNMLVMAFVFSRLFGREGIGLDYPVYVLSGNIVFSLMRTGTVSSLPCLVNQRGLLTKTKVPIWTFPTAQVFSSVTTFGFSYIALILVMLIRLPAGVQFYWTMFMALIMLPALILFTLGLSYILSALYVYFRDIKHLYSVAVTLWTYLTPLFYSLETLKMPESAMAVMKFNPMYHFVDYFRMTLMGQVPSWRTHLIIYGVGIGFFVIGLLFFNWRKKTMVLHL